MFRFVKYSSPATQAEAERVIKNNFVELRHSMLYQLNFLILVASLGLLVYVSADWVERVGLFIFVLSISIYLDFVNSSYAKEIVRLNNELEKVR